MTEEEAFEAWWHSPDGCGPPGDPGVYIWQAACAWQRQQDAAIAGDQYGWLPDGTYIDNLGEYILNQGKQNGP